MEKNILVLDELRIQKKLFYRTVGLNLKIENSLRTAV